MKKYEASFKQKIINLYLNENRSFISLSKEFSVSPSAISNWVKTYREKSQIKLETKNDEDFMLKIQNLHKRIKELEEINLQLFKTMSLIVNSSNPSSTV